jgi:hypothetical protein
MAHQQDENWLVSNVMDQEDCNAHPSPAGGKHLEILVKGHLNSQWSDWLEGLEATLLDNGDTVLSGTIADQAALMGILNKLNRLNLALLSVNEVNQIHINHLREGKMDNTRTLNSSFETAAWGALFIWWGITELFNFLPAGTGAIGIGLILLGLNVARSLNGIPTRGFTTVLGILALVWGGLGLASSVLVLPFELPVFAILLITLGVILLGREILRTRNA